MTARRGITRSFRDSGSPNWSTDLCMISFHFLYICAYLLRQCVHKHFNRLIGWPSASPQWKTCGSTHVLDFSWWHAMVSTSSLDVRWCRACQHFDLESTTLILQLHMVGTTTTYHGPLLLLLGQTFGSVGSWTLIPDGKAKGMPLTLFIADRSDTDGRWQLVQEFCRYPAWIDTCIWTSEQNSVSRWVFLEDVRKSDVNQNHDYTCRMKNSNFLLWISNVKLQQLS